MPPIFISTILQDGKTLKLAHYFPYDVKLRLLAHSRSFLANQKARNPIVGAENLLKPYMTTTGHFGLVFEENSGKEITQLRFQNVYRRFQILPVKRAFSGRPVFVDSIN